MNMTAKCKARPPPPQKRVRVWSRGARVEELEAAAGHGEVGEAELRARATLHMHASMHNKQ